MKKYSIGIDISKKDFHACFSMRENESIKVLRSGTFLNTTDGFKKLEGWIKDCLKKWGDAPLKIVMEATGVYFENCAFWLNAKGYQLSVVLPNKAKKYLQSFASKSKNDKADAKGLSRLGLEIVLENWEPMDGYFYELRSITRHHQALQEQKTTVTNQLEANAHGAHPNKMIERSLNKILSSLNKQLEITKKAIEDLIEQNEEVARKIKKIAKIKGLATLSIAVVVAETNGFILFKNISQLISYCGYDVVENQSGKRVGKTKISKKGNARIRRILHMPAFTAVTHEPSIKAFYERLVSRHGLKMKSYVAVQKKLLILIYTLWKKDESFDKNYVWSQDIQPEKGAGAFSGPALKKPIKKISPALQD